MSMTKKDYELIASIFEKNISSTNPRETEIRYNSITINKALVMQFADVLAKHDLKFNRNKFLLACGLKINDLRKS